MITYVEPYARPTTMKKERIAGYNYGCVITLEKRVTASLPSVSYLAHRRCEGYGHDLENSAHLRDEGGKVEIERPRTRRENRGGVARLLASNTLRDARFASRFLFLLSYFFFVFLFPVRTSRVRVSKGFLRASFLLPFNHQLLYINHSDYLRYSYARLSR